MKEITNVTIISTNLNKKLFDKYEGYHIIENDFSYNELKEKKKVILFNILNNLKEDDIRNLLKFLKENHILFIIATNNMELVLFTEKLMVYDKENVLIEGNTIEVLKNEKLLKRLGFKLPFMFELSLLLKDYDLINDIYLDKEGLVDKLWK